VQCQPRRWHFSSRGDSSCSSAPSCRADCVSLARPDISAPESESRSPAPFADQEPPLERSRRELLAALHAEPRSIPSKLLYDERGSQLFDRICEVDEYYLTRTELAILRRDADAIWELIGPGAALIEYGSGSSFKTRTLLDRAPELAAYIPVDISREHLLASAARLEQRYPHLEVLPLCADYGTELVLPATRAPVRRRVAFFSGSSIGNFEAPDAREFLMRAARLCGPAGGLLIGVDLHKSTPVLEAAYDDAAGVSAAFALNVLERINRDFDADFEPKQFEYVAHYDEARRRIEMSLVSLAEQTVRIGDAELEIDAGERIRTEYSHKYTLEDFEALAEQAGLSVERAFVDDDQLFSVQYLAVR
jgi:dimethylhistidine N-methyltransferase